MSFSFLDIVVLVILVLMAIKGFKTGFLKELMFLGTLVLGLILGFAFSAEVAGLLDQRFGEQVYHPILAFALIILAVSLVFFFIKSLLKSLLESLKLANLDGVLGLVLGLVEGLILSMVFLALLRHQPFIPAESIFAGSNLALVIESFAPVSWLLPGLE